MSEKKIRRVTTVTEEYIDVPSNEKTHIICILDRSGSMGSIIDDSIGGFNTFLKQQKELPDEATITVVLFDDKYEVLYDNVDIKNAEELTIKQWYPRGTTALYDAIGKTINTEKSAFARLGNEKPNKVLVCIVTDGYENASKEYNINSVKDLIGACEKEKWNFIYLAANQSAFDVGSSFGVSVGNTFTYTTSTAGVNIMNQKMSGAAKSYRSMSSTDASFDMMSQSLLDDDDVNIGNISTSIDNTDTDKV